MESKLQVGLAGASGKGRFLAQGPHAHRLVRESRIRASHDSFHAIDDDAHIKPTGKATFAAHTTAATLKKLWLGVYEHIGPTFRSTAPPFGENGLSAGVPAGAETSTATLIFFGAADDAGSTFTCVSAFSASMAACFAAGSEMAAPPFGENGLSAGATAGADASTVRPLDFCGAADDAGPTFPSN